MKKSTIDESELPNFSREKVELPLPLGERGQKIRQLFEGELNLDLEKVKMPTILSTLLGTSL